MNFPVDSSMQEKNLRIVRCRNFYYVQKRLFGDFWLYTDRYFRAISFRRTWRYINPKTARAAYVYMRKYPFEVIEYLDENSTI